MATDIPANPQVLTDVPQGMVGPEGSELVSIYAYPTYFTLTDGEYVNTMAIDFASFQFIGADLIAQAMQQIIPHIVANGEEILCYGLFRYTIFDLQVPDEICVFGICFPPPFGGSHVVTSYGYRLVVYTRPSYSAYGSYQARALGPAVILAIAAALIAVLTVIVGIIGMSTGTIRWSEIKDFTHDLITAPGQNVSQALTGPLVAFGIALVGAAIVLPMAIGSIEAQVPVGPGSVTLGGTLGSGQPPTRGGQRR